MTDYIHRIAFFAHLEHVEACNRAANALGRSGQNFTMRLSPSGAEPATHLGGSAIETPAFLATLSFAPDLPGGIQWPADLALDDWQVVADHLTVAAGDAATTNPGLQVEDIVTAADLKRILPDEDDV